MTAAIRIEIRPLGFTHIAITHGHDEAGVDHIFRLYRAIRPELRALEQAARRQGTRAGWTDDEQP
jgi:hypothetical protein